MTRNHHRPRPAVVSTTPEWRNIDINQSLYILDLPYQREAKDIDEGRSDVQNYFKRLRKTSKELKYYAVGEYGEKTNRPHYHAIVFNAENDDISSNWKAGFTHLENVTQAAIHYVTKYMINRKSDINRQKEFSLSSKGLGKSYVDVAGETHKKQMSDTVYYAGGHKSTMPRYLKQKIFDKEQLEIIAEKNKDLIKTLSHDERIQENKYKRYTAKQSSKSNKLK